MPWDNNTGGGRGNNGGPWGQPSGGGGPRRTGGTPSLEELLNRGRDRFGGQIPGGRWAILGVVLVVIALWLLECVYTIAPQEVGVELLFGKPQAELSQPGLHFLFWPIETVERVVTTENREPVGFALWFYTYSTFQGRHGIWLEDLFVDPGQRGRGIGKALLQNLARRCVAEELGRLEWWVLDWNAPSIDFYRSQGAVLQDEWTKCRVDGEALQRLGAA